VIHLNTEKKKGRNEMKIMKRLGALCCATAMLLSLAACNTNTAGTTSEASVAEILAAADQKVSEAKSMEADMTMDMDMVMSMEGQSYTMKTSTLMNMVMFSNPMKMKIDMKVNTDLGELTAGSDVEPMNIQMYIAGSDNNYNMYSNYGTGWTSQPIDMSSLEMYNPKANMDIYLKSADSFQVDGEETINDMKTTKYTGVIKGDAMEEVLNASGMLDNMNSLGVDMGDLDFKALYSDMGDLPISVWINEEGYPVRYEMDMAELMNKFYEKLVEQMGEEAAGGQITCTKVQVSMNCFNYNNAADFEVPAEAMQ
jgi:hypothetical protein